jgi:hypothetical protein
MTNPANITIDSNRSRFRLFFPLEGTVKAGTFLAAGLAGFGVLRRVMVSPWLIVRGDVDLAESGL